MSSITLTRVPVYAISVKELRAKYDPMLNPWCQHCDCPPDKRPCKRSKCFFTFDEIREAIEKQDFEPVRNERWGYDNTYQNGEVNQDRCNRDRHVRRIAFLVVHPAGRHPIRMKTGTDVIDDGGHRFAAAIYRGEEIICARDKADFDVESGNGHQFP